MLQSVRDWLKERPHLYDVVKRAKRLVYPESDPVYEFFDKFSRSRNGKVSFIQIGASEGLRNDPIREFIIRDRWSGVFVEPLQSVFELLKENYAYSKNPDLLFVNAAISSSNQDSISFWTYDDDLLANLSLEERLNFLQKASFDKRHVSRLIDSEEDTEGSLKEIQVQCLTFGRLVEEYWNGKDIDLLVIDAEGHEMTIITSVDFSKIKPQNIFYESHNLGPDERRLSDYLTGHGYGIIDFLGDTMAVLGTDS